MELVLIVVVGFFLWLIGSALFLTLKALSGVLSGYLRFLLLAAILIALLLGL